ncbi:MAG: autotransporter outer membrane beta-barrel domain-containing protein, partial [Chthoniobacterales bacterium]
MRRLFSLSIVMAALLCVVSHARAQSTDWGSVLSNTYWFVPTENMLAYMSSGTSFANPIVAADQTLWSLGTFEEDGTFTGESAATLKFGLNGESTATNTMQGLVTAEGQIRIVFTSTTGGPTTTGIGQMRDRDGTLYMQMQMITGNDGEGGVLTTHWAYMESYDPETFEPPVPTPEVGLRSTEWAWVEGTSWNLHNDALFGTDGVGTF